MGSVMVMGGLYRRMKMSLKDTGKRTKSMGKASTSIKTGSPTRASGRTISTTGKEKRSGRKSQSMRENTKMGRSTI